MPQVAAGRTRRARTLELSADHRAERGQCHDDRAEPRSASQGDQLDGSEEREDAVGQEAGGAEHQAQRHPQRQPQADTLVGIDNDGGGAAGIRSDAAPVQERPAAAGDDVQGVRDGLPFVVVYVARQVENAVRVERQVAGFQHLHPRLVRLAVGEGRIGRHEQDPGWLGLGPALREEDALPEVGAPELAVDAPEVEPRRERQRPVGRLLDRAVPREPEAAGLPHRGAAQDRGERLPRLTGQAQGLGELVDVELPDQRAFDALPDGITGRRRGSAGHGLRQVLERAPAEEATETVEAVVPVVIAGDAEQHATCGVWRAFLQDRVPWSEQAALELVPGGQRIRDIAPEEEDISSRQPPGLLAAERVLGEHHAPHGQAQVVVVPGVAHEVDPHWTTEALGQGAPGFRRAQHAAHSVEEVRPGLSGRIQSRRSSCWLAAATATRCRRWPTRAVIPNQRIANGECAPRWKRPTRVVGSLGASGEPILRDPEPFPAAPCRGRSVVFASPRG